MHSTTLYPSESFTPKHTEPAVVCQDGRLMHTLTPTQKAVMACIGTVCGVKLLAQAVGISHRHARRIVRQLSDMGAITITAHAKGGRGNHAAFRTHVLLHENADMGAHPKEDTPPVAPVTNEDIPPGVSSEAYAVATKRLGELGLTWDALTLLPMPPIGTFLYFPNGDRVSPFGELRIKTRTPAEIFADEERKKLERSQARVAALLAEAQKGDSASGTKEDTPQSGSGVLGNQRARTHVGALDPFPIETDPSRSIQSSFSGHVTKKDDSPDHGSIPSPGGDPTPRAHARGFVVTDEMVRAVEDAARVYGKRTEIRALIAEIGQDFRNCHWSIANMARRVRAEHFAKYPNSQFGFNQLANWLRNKRRDALREQHRALTPAIFYQPSKAS